MGWQQRLIDFFEGKPEPVEKQLSDAAVGVFRCYVHGTLAQWRGAFSYLFSGVDSHDLTNALRGQKAVVRYGTVGISTGSLTWGRNDKNIVGAALTHRMHSLDVRWEHIRHCAVETDTDSRLVFLLFHNPSEAREEWVAFRFAYDSVRDHFVEKLAKSSVAVVRLAGPVI